jgi:hypothetical protein
MLDGGNPASICKDNCGFTIDVSAQPIPVNMRLTVIDISP